MDFPFGLLALMAWLIYRFASDEGSQAAKISAAPRPLLTPRPRRCPFCDGDSEYHWDPAPSGGHRLRCRKCRDVYTTNAGAETRWSVSADGGANELCWVLDETQAREFLDKVLRPAAPGTRFEVRLGADEGTPYCWEYYLALKEAYEREGLGPDTAKH